MPALNVQSSDSVRFKAVYAALNLFILNLPISNEVLKSSIHSSDSVHD